MSLLIDAQALWRPLEDEPLFRSELLLGVGELPEDLYNTICGYLKQVAETRTAPLHVATAWNALHFGFDLSLRGYCADVLDPEQFRLLTPVDTVRSALPVGAFVRVERGVHWLWAEVVAKFGAHPEVEQDGWTPRSISGAPASAKTGQPAQLVERAILDMEAFGSATPTERTEILRLRQRERLLDRHGHLCGPVYYPTPEAADLDDVAFYTHYLLHEARPLLLGGPLGGVLENPRDEDVLRRALEASLRTVADLLRMTTGLSAWGPYGTPTNRFEADRTNFSPTGKNSSRGLLDTMYRTRDEPRYVALWPLLESSDETALGTAAAARCIVHANLALAEYAAGVRETDAPGVVHIRLDDSWQSGGIWRAQRTPVPASVLEADPLYPLGLGYLESTAGVSAGDPAPAPAEPSTTARGPNADPPVEPGDLAAFLDFDPSSSHESEADQPSLLIEHQDDFLVVFRTALSEDSLRDGILPIPHTVAEFVPEGLLILELHHDGAALAQSEQTREVYCHACLLKGCRWPASFYPGIELTIAVARHARRIVACTRLIEPLYPTGGSEYLWAFDERIMDKTGRQPKSRGPGDGLTLDPWHDQAPRTGRRHRTHLFSPPVDSLRRLIVAAIRRHGMVGTHRETRLTGQQVFSALFGPGESIPGLLWSVIHTCEQLVDDRLLSQEVTAIHSGSSIQLSTVFVWWPSHHATSARNPGEPSNDLPGTESLRKHIREHWVPPRLRRLPASHRATVAAADAYAQWISEVNPSSTTRLPDGLTFVKGYRRGDVIDQRWSSTSRLH